MQKKCTCVQKDNQTTELFHTIMNFMFLCAQRNLFVGGAKFLKGTYLA